MRPIDSRRQELDATLDRISQTAAELRTVLNQQREMLREHGIRLPAGTRYALSDIMRRLDVTRQLVAGLRHESDQYRALADIAALVNSSLDLTQVLDQAMDTIIRLTGAERGYMLLRDEASGQLTLRTARNVSRQTIDSSEFEVSRSVTERVARTGQPIITTNAQEDQRFQDADSIVSYNLRSILCVPLKVKGQLTGVVYTDNKLQTGLFTEHTRDLLQAFANQAAVAIENARLFKQMVESLEAMTEMKNLQDNIFASMASGVITTDLQGFITYMNRRAEQLLGVKLDDHAPHLAALIPGLAPRLDMLLRVVQQLDRRLIGLEFETPLGQRTASLSMNFSPLKDAHDQTQGVAIVLDDLTESKRREAQIAGVRRYLPVEIVDGIRSPAELKLGGTRQLVTILFADVRGFSTFSEQVAPETLVEILNRHMTLASDAIHQQQGVIDKFMGDAVMALYNTPLRPQPDHTLRAVRSALTLLDDMRAYHRTTPPGECLKFGIGIHTGEAVVGNVGSPERLDYTAIGSSVNLAKRLQENAKPDQILLSQQAWEVVRDHVEVKRLGPLMVRGLSHPVEVYELLTVH